LGWSSWHLGRVVRLTVVGRRDVVLPTTFPGAIELFIACALAAWVLVLLGKLLYPLLEDVPAV
jgi:hypothetical protein